MVRIPPKSNLVELETNEEVNKSKTDEKEVRNYIVKQYIYFNFLKKIIDSNRI